MEYLYIFLLFNIFSQSLDAQSKQDYIWLDGKSFSSSGINGFILDFNDSPTEVTEHENNIGIRFANASICDKDGNLLMYMNGCAVMNSDFEMMPNGDSISYNILWEYLNKDCNRGIGDFQDNIILPAPENSKEFYIIHKPRLYNGIGLVDSIQIWFTKVNLDLEGGLGDVTVKNQVLDGSKLFLIGYLTAIKQLDNNDWWIIQGYSEDSIFNIYTIDGSGIKFSHSQNSHFYMNYERTSASGTAKFSPDGTKYAFYNYYNQLHIYDFDRESGLISNHKMIDVIDEINNDLIVFSSVEWSPNSRFIYTATDVFLHQIDLWEDDIEENGIRLIDTYNGTQDPFPTNFFIMAQAPDCKIYLAPQSSTNSYHVINKPDELGTACNFVQNGLKLPVPSGLGSMPNFPRFRVDEEDKCDPTLTSVFGNAVYYRRDLQVYPSPSGGRYTVSVPDDVLSGTLTVLDLEGRSILQERVTLGSQTINIDITSYPSGYYHIELYPDTNRDQIFYGVKVVKM